MPRWQALASLYDGGAARQGRTSVCARNPEVRKTRGRPRQSAQVGKAKESAALQASPLCGLSEGLGSIDRPRLDLRAIYRPPLVVGFKNLERWQRLSWYENWWWVDNQCLR